LAATSHSGTCRGLLLVIDADQVRLEVGYTLEGVLPDAFAAYVEHRQMVPFFERGRVADGILSTTELIVTRAQMDNVARAFRDCGAAATHFPPRLAHCAPYFFERVEGGWALDFVTMQHAIRFGRSNAWRLAERFDHPYVFAFEDWTFDANGFPRARQ
jgi:uncharacterized membrane protein YgcG